jgi:hypothetical protein
MNKKITELKQENPPEGALHSLLELEKKVDQHSRDSADFLNYLRQLIKDNAN